MDDMGSNSVKGERFLFSTTRSDYFWGPPNLLLREYRERGFRGTAVGVTLSDHLPGRCYEYVDLFLYSPIYLHRVDRDKFTSSITRNGFS